MLIARTDATRDVLLRVVQTAGLIAQDSYLDVRLGHFELVIQLRGRGAATLN